MSIYSLPGRALKQWVVIGLGQTQGCVVLGGRRTWSHERGRVEQQGRAQRLESSEANEMWGEGGDFRESMNWGASRPGAGPRQWLRAPAAEAVRRRKKWGGSAAENGIAWHECLGVGECVVQERCGFSLKTRGREPAGGGAAINPQAQALSGEGAGRLPSHQSRFCAGSGQLRQPAPGRQRPSKGWQHTLAGRKRGPGRLGLRLGSRLGLRCGLRLQLTPWPPPSSWACPAMECP